MPNHDLNNFDIEGFGISLVEASYCKNVVIAGNSGGAVESVENGKSGYLIDYNDFNRLPYQQVQSYVNKLLSDKNKMYKMSEHGRKFVLDNFLPENAKRMFKNINFDQK